MLEVSGLTTKYGEISALREASLHVGAGEVVGLIGPNGAGKTTLLNTIAGLLAPSAGGVVFDGDDITGHSPEGLLRSGLALVPEHRRIFVNLTVEENLRIGGVTVPPSDRPGLLDEIASGGVHSDGYNSSTSPLPGPRGVNPLAITSAVHDEEIRACTPMLRDLDGYLDPNGPFRHIEPPRVLRRF